MRKFLFCLIILSSCSSGNTDMQDMSSYQKQNDMVELSNIQQDRDEKIRKTMKQEHKEDILFNLAVTKEQVNIDNQKFGMLYKSHFGNEENLTWENVDRYNSMMAKERERLNTEDGVVKDKEDASESNPNIENSTKEPSTSYLDLQDNDQTNRNVTYVNLK